MRLNILSCLYWPFIFHLFLIWHFKNSLWLHHFPFFFLSSNPSYIPPLALSQIHALLLCCSICVCMCAYYMWIHKYINIICSVRLVLIAWCDFRTDRLVSDSQLGCSFLGMTMPPSFRIPYSPVVLFLVVEPCENDPFHVTMSIGVVLGLV